MAAPRPKMLAALKKAFSAATGCSVRTARRQADSNSQAWQRFVAQYGMAAAEKVHASAPMTLAEAGAIQVISPASPLEVQAPVLAGRPDVELAEPERIVKQMWQIYQESATAWRESMQGGDKIGAMAFGQSTIKALEAYYRALKNLETWEISQRRLIPMSEWQAVMPLMTSLFNLMRGFPAETALTANPAAPQLARAAGVEWLESRFNPQAKALFDKLSAAA